jgi:hypothetical protein
MQEHICRSGYRCVQWGEGDQWLSNGVSVPLCVTGGKEQEKLGKQEWGRIKEGAWHPCGAGRVLHGLFHRDVDTQNQLT